VPAYFEIGQALAIIRDGCFSLLPLGMQTDLGTKLIAKVSKSMISLAKNVSVRYTKYAKLKSQ